MCLLLNLHVLIKVFNMNIKSLENIVRHDILLLLNAMCYGRC